ncbi:nucleotidyltransferase [Pseudomonas monteilii]|uniref:Nucleotidyltransferase n=1 Tax=Pseudomonas monteilii TaxID=76759 RepID=A0AAE6R8K1_9PSED|nr:hypothetical protein [Pseudomonas monteilii]QHB26440.1 nucleotidyltransferase [Pseudomonas monteilii]
MSLEKEIYDKLVSVYPSHVKAITDLSHNPTGAKNFIGSSETGFDFDLVFNLSPSYASFHNEKSPDALFCVNDKLCFVEFKEGGHKKIEIRSKIHEGVVTLFMFVQKHLPHISKADFCALDVHYAVVARETQNFSSVALAFQAASEKYQLKNMEGFLVRKTLYAFDRVKIAELLKGLTNGSLSYIDYYESSTGLPTRITV